MFLNNKLCFKTNTVDTEAEDGCPETSSWPGVVWMRAARVCPPMGLNRLEERRETSLFASNATK